MTEDTMTVADVLHKGGELPEDLLRDERVGPISA